MSARWPSSAPQPSGDVGVTTARLLRRSSARSHDGQRSAIGSGRRVPRRRLPRHQRASLQLGISRAGAVVGRHARCRELSSGRQWTDVAVVKIDAGHLPVADLGSATESAGRADRPSPSARRRPRRRPVGDRRRRQRARSQIEGRTASPARHDPDRRADRRPSSSGGALCDGNGVRHRASSPRSASRGRRRRSASPRRSTSALRRRGHHRNRRGSSLVARGRGRDLDADGGVAPDRRSSVAARPHKRGLTSDDIIVAVDGTQDRRRCQRSCDASRSITPATPSRCGRSA